MKKTALWLVLAVGAVGGCLGCQEKSTGDHMEDALDSAGKAAQSAADDVKEAVEDVTDKD